jgi:hypothetical protein
MGRDGVEHLGRVLSHYESNGAVVRPADQDAYLRWARYLEAGEHTSVLP